MQLRLRDSVTRFYSSGFFIFCRNFRRYGIRSSGCITSVLDTGGKPVAKFAAQCGVVDTGGAPSLANISAYFRENSKRPKCYIWVLRGR
jgi:hypothetical protein